MRLPIISIAMMMVVSLTACSGGGGGGSTYVPPAKGMLSLTVVDADTALGIENARVVVIDGDTGDTIDVLTTDADGKVSKIYNTGALQLKVSANLYSPSPAPGIPPLPVQIIKDQVTPITVNLFTLPPAARGSISGLVTNSQGTPIAGALVMATATDGTTHVSSLAGLDGSYVLYNVPAGVGVTLDAYSGGYNFDQITGISVYDAIDTQQDVAATEPATAQFSGHVSFTATSGDIVDVTLVHPDTREVLPGLRTYIDKGGDFVMNGVPNGSFEFIASLKNDGYVLDPDESVTQGIQNVVITNNQSVDGGTYKVTGAVDLTNPGSPDKAVPVLTATPTFTWVKTSSYSSADEYVIEVVDESGNTIWGGFDSSNLPIVTVPAGTDPLEIAYGGPALEAGHYYQLRVYAYDSTANAKLSVSETLDGLFIVEIPAL